MCFRLNERESDILSRRFSQVPETLDQIAQSYGVTRERIRQLQGQGSRSLRGSPGYRKSRKAAAHSLEVNGYLTRETVTQGIHQLYPNVSLDLKAAVGAVVFDDLTRGDRIRYGDALIRDRQIRLAVNDIQAVVNDGVIDHPVCTVNQIVEVLISDPRYAGVSSWIRIVVSDLWPILRKRADSRLADLRQNATAANLAHEVIERFGRPLHWTVVGHEVNRQRERLGLRSLSERGTHNRMQSLKDMFAYAGQGTYGLREWGADVPYVRDLIIEVLAATGHPLTMAEIASEAAKKRVIKESSLAFYLGLDPDFYLSRSGKYGLPEWLDPNPTIRTPRDYVQELNDREKRLNSSFAKQRQ